MRTLYIGLMSGTSMDGVDGVLVDLAHIDQGQLAVRAHAHRAFEPALAQALLVLNTSGDDELHRAALAANALSRVYAAVVDDLLGASGAAAVAVDAIGAHGQTVRHRPGEFDGTGYTLQLNNPALLAELCGIDVVADLRVRDVAAGGQGAPLVPGFHRAVFGETGRTTAVVNIGGMSNVTVLDANGRTFGWDCGPGNVLMDHWCRVHTGNAFDAGGTWAASGQVDTALLAGMLGEPYFSKVPPKSTGRDLFHADWLRAQLQRLPRSLPAVDVQATLAELTAACVADELNRGAASARAVLICGGGAYNAHLVGRIAARLPGVTVAPTDARGLPADQVEACAFAWMARAWRHRQCASLPDVTGARGPRVLGALYPAG